MPLCNKICDFRIYRLFLKVNSNSNPSLHYRQYLNSGIFKKNLVLVGNQSCKFDRKSDRKLDIQKNLHSDYFSTKSPQTVESGVVADSDTFVPIFRFAHIAIIGFVCRTKVYLTASLFTGLPIIFYGWMNNQVGLQEVLSYGSITGFSFVTLGFFGEIFRRCVCIVYISKDETTVKIAHMSFWGRRKDVEVPLNDIIPLSETSERVGHIFWKINFYENSEASKLIDRSNLIISTRYGNVLDEKALVKIFGNEILSNNNKDK